MELDINFTDSNDTIFTDITFCGNANISTWPWPRVFITPYRTLGVVRGTTTNLWLLEMHLLQHQWHGIAVKDLGLTTQIDQVDVADFGPFYVISTLGIDTNGNKVIQTFVRNMLLTPIFGALDSFTLPAVGTCCNFRGQFFGGNIYSPSANNYWLNLSTNSLAWAAIGSFEFDPSVDPTAGFAKSLFGEVSGQEAIIYKVLPLGNFLIIYSDSGKIKFDPTLVASTFTFGTEFLEGIGVRSGNHVAGNESIHGFIDANNEFWIVEIENSFTRVKLTKRGYKEFLTPIVNYRNSEEDSRTIVSYLPKNKTFFISNGNSCLVINEFGAYTCHQLVSSILSNHYGEVQGTFKNSNDLEARVVTDTLDFKVRGIKSVESIIAGINHPQGSKARFAVDWRADKTKNFRRSTWKPSGYTGEAAIGVAASEFRLGVKVDNYQDTYLEYINANVKYSDHRFRRGPTDANA